MDSQFFPPGFKLYRKDRNCNGWGVLIAISNNLASSPVPELDPDCEIVWAKVQLVGAKDLYLCSFYNPKISNELNLSELEASLGRLRNNPNACIRVVVGGDFNQPGWNWVTKTLKPIATLSTGSATS